MRILIFNWRDIKHPRAGGAERVTYEIARRWVTWGHHVTWFAASFPGASSHETIDGIEIWRAGSQATVHWQAFRHYRRFFRGRFDVIIDEVNTIPFLTPLYAREPVVLYLNQLAREVWFYEAPLPLALCGYVAEPLYLQPYRRIPLLTISASTKNDARRIGLHGPATIMPMAIDFAPLSTLPDPEEKEKQLTLIYVGRVVPSKRVSDIIHALGKVRHQHNISAQLWIVGSLDPPYRATLNRLVEKEKLTGAITFWGRVDTAEKAQLMQRAHILLMTSVREGWGLVVSEAAAMGTPAVVYNVAGLRDSTVHQYTGIVCPNDAPHTLAASLAELWRNHDMYQQLREQAWLQSTKMSWESTAAVALSAIQNAFHKHSCR